MSESTNEALPATLADLMVRAETRAGGGSGVEVLVATWGGGTKTLELKEMDLGEQFDLAELTGPNAGNAAWLGMATVAASVRSLDGVPIVRQFTRESIKATLNKIGLDGLRAGMMALNGYRGGGEAMVVQPDQAEHRAAVGN